MLFKSSSTLLYYIVMKTLSNGGEERHAVVSVGRALVRITRSTACISLQLDFFFLEKSFFFSAAAVPERKG